MKGGGFNEYILVRQKHGRGLNMAGTGIREKLTVLQVTCGDISQSQGQSRVKANGCTCATWALLATTTTTAPMSDRQANGISWLPRTTTVTAHLWPLTIPADTAETQVSCDLGRFRESLHGDSGFVSYYRRS